MSPPVPGLFDEVDFLVPVLYYGLNESSPEHEKNVFGYTDTTLALARGLRRSNGETIPIYVNTKFTYGHSIYEPPFAGWVEADTTRRLVESFRSPPNAGRVERVMYWCVEDSCCWLLLLKLRSGSSFGCSSTPCSLWRLCSSAPAPRSVLKSLSRQVLSGLGARALRPAQRRRD